MSRSQKLPNLDYMGDGEAAQDPDPSLCPTQRGCFGLARYHGATESQTFAVVGAFF